MTTRATSLADDRGDALVIDPAMGERALLAELREAGLTVVAILNTHGHGDHTHDNLAMRRRRRRASPSIVSMLPLAPSGAARSRFRPARRTISSRKDPSPSCADVEDGRTAHPWAHRGSTCFHLPQAGVLFSGDVLFAGNVGRVDTPGATRKRWSGASPVS